MNATNATHATTASLCELALAARTEAPAAINALLDDLYRRLPGLVRGQLRRTNAWLDASTQDDIMQEVVLAVLRKDLPRFDAERGTFAVLLAYRVRWCLADTLRRMCRRAETVDVDDEADTLAAPELSEPDHALEQAHHQLRLLVLRDEVEFALADQPRALHAVVEHDFEGTRLETIGEQMGSHTSTACRQRQKGLRLLAERLPASLQAAA